MTEKTQPAGWVVEVKTGPATEPGGPQSYAYFNVAIADVAKAVAAVSKQGHIPDAWGATAVRPLTQQEIAAIELMPGVVKPA